MSTDDGVVLGGFRDGGEAFLSDVDRRRHLYVIGKSGSGKSTLLQRMMISDLARSRGFALLDPHGQTAEYVADCTPHHRYHDTIYWEPRDLASGCLAFNPLHNVLPDNRPLVAANMVEVFSHAWGISHDSSPRLLYFLHNAIRTLLDAPDQSLLGLQKIFIDREYRRRLLRYTTDPLVRSFWEQELPQMAERDSALTIAALANKSGMLMTSPLREILGQIVPTLDLRRVIDRHGALLVNLKELGQGPTFLLGGFLTTAFGQAARRSDIPEDERPDFTLYADEFQTFTVESFSTILSQSRKWRLNLVLAHQFIGQLQPGLRQAVIGNVGSLVAFRLGGEDSDTLHPELQNREMVYDYDRTGYINTAKPIPLTESPTGSAWVKLLEDGEPTETRLVDMYRPEPDTTGRLAAVRTRARVRHLRPREQVQDRISRFLSPPARFRRSRMPRAA